MVHVFQKMLRHLLQLQKKKNIDLSIINAVNKSNQDRIIKIANKIISNIEKKSTICFWV